MRTALLIVLSLLLHPGTGAQPLAFLRSDSGTVNRELPQVLVLSLRPQYGRVLHTDTPVLESSIELHPSSAQDIRLGISSYGRKRWQQLHNYPDYGLGYYHCRLMPGDNPLGQPRAVYYYYNQSLLRSGRISLNYDFATGLSFNFNKYDLVENPLQVAIGSKYNGYVSLGFEGRISFSDQLSLAVGVNHTHFSNGRIRTPQRGINLITVNGSIITNFLNPVHSGRPGYDRGTSLPEPIRHTIPQFTPRWEYYLVTNIAVATPEYHYKDRELVYSIYTASMAAARHYSYKGKLVAGLDFFYDESLSEKYNLPLEELPGEDKRYFGVQAGHELMINRFTLVTQVGIPLDNRDATGNWYGRIGMRIDILPNLFIRYALKLPDNWQSDFIEWGLGVNVYGGRGS